MSIVCTDEIGALMSRFGSFQDAVVRRIEHRFGVEEGAQCAVTMSAEDRSSEDGWSNVTFVVRGVTEVAFREDPRMRQILTDGLALRRIDQQWWLDFAPFCADPESADEIRLSDFYVTGRSLMWQVTPFRED
jgi:hypothetical protein